MQKLEKKYGLLSAVCMVAGSVIGSGVFFKAEVINRATKGDAMLGITAWVLGGIIMLLCMGVFSLLAQRYEDSSSVADYCDAIVGKRYGYFAGWFMAVMYCPALVSVLAWLSARYTLLFLGISDPGGGLCMLLSSVYLAFSYCQNILFPKYCGKIQIVTMIIKLIPLVLMIIMGTAKGVSGGTLSMNFSVHNEIDPAGALFSAIASSAFAYDGWIGAASIGAELKNSKKNLPRALIIGGSIVMTVYVLYFAGISGAVKNEILISSGTDGIKMAFANILGEGFSSVLTLFVAVSCLGALNATMFSCSRAMYSIAKKGMGPMPHLFSQLDDISGMPASSGAAGLGISMVWLLFYYGANLSENSLWGYGFDSSELPIASIYAMYIPLFIMCMKDSALSAVKRFFLIAPAILACGFMVFSAVYSHRGEVINYLCAFTAIMLLGALFEKSK